jgi:ubiquinone/menaquinone biosynthesis C-methylase UbiE
MGKWFSKMYDPFMKPLESRGFRDIRKNLVQKSEGKVLEIGSGTGLNFPYYVDAAEVTALEPDSFMRERSLSRATHAKVPIRVISGNAEQLPFQDNEFDVVVGTLVLCTINNPNKALEEMRRVCKAGGKVLFFEHVRMNDSILGFLQDWLTPAWKRLCDGCHLNRNTFQLIKQTGFKVLHVEHKAKGLILVIEAINLKLIDVDIPHRGIILLGI